MAQATRTRGPGRQVRDKDAPVLATGATITADGDNGAYTYVGRNDACAVRLVAAAAQASTEATIVIEGAETVAGAGGRVLGAFNINQNAGAVDMVLRLSNVFLPYMRWAAMVVSGGFTANVGITVHPEYDKLSDTEKSGFEDATGEGAS